MASAAYTPLESLLLFQSLAAYGAEPTTFGKISELLKGNPLVQSAKAYDPGRLSPDALRELYLGLLKDEIKTTSSDGGDLDASGAAEDSDQASRKRKVVNPPLPSPQEAAQHTDLIPPLIMRLYARYKDSVTKEIREEERRYDSLKKEIEEGERQAAVDAQLIARTPGGADGPEKPQEEAQDAAELPVGSLESTTPQEPLAQGETILQRQKNQLEESADAPQASSGTQKPAPFEPPVNAGEVPRSDLGYETAKDPEPLKTAEITSTVTSTTEAATARPTITEPQDPAPQAGQEMPQRSSAPPIASQPVATPQILPQPQPSIHGYSLPPQVPPQVVPYPPRPEISQSSAPPIISGAGSPSNFLNLSPDGTKSQPAHVPTTSPAQHQFFPPPSPAQTVAHTPVQPKSKKQGKQPQIQNTIPQYYAQPPNYPYPPHVQPPIPSQVLQGQQPWPPHHWPSPGGIQLPPFQSSPIPQQDTKRPPPLPQLRSPASIPYQHSPYAAPPPLPQPGTYQGPQTPIPNPFNQHPGRLSLRLDTSTTSTRWKPLDAASVGKTPGSPVRPGPDAVSPISEKAPSPEPEVVAEEQTPVPKSRSKRKDLAEEDVEEAVPTGTGAKRGKPRSVRGGRSQRGRTKHLRGASPRSTATSNRTRSQSIISNVDENPEDELSMDNETIAHRRVKHEPAATPSGAGSEEDKQTGKTIRGRHVPTRTPSDFETPRPSMKRKRSQPPSPSAEQGDEEALPASKSNMVLATKNFSRISSTVLSAISGHKHASIFAKPVKETEAENYYDLIYRPQDMKSIKSAIQAGSRVVNAASTGTPNIDSPGPSGAATPSTKGSSFYLPISADVVPPRGIVNSSQLEKEVMRMFANAIMFNPDPQRGFGRSFKLRPGGHEDDDADDEDEMAAEEDEEGRIATDTREMFQAVEKTVEDWKSAERAVEDAASGRSGKLRDAQKDREEDEDDELAADVDGVEESDGATGTVKRRRRA